MENEDINYFPELAFKKCCSAFKEICQADTGSFLIACIVESFQKEKFAQHFA